MLAQRFTRKYFVRTSNLAWSPQHCIIVAVLMLVCDFILCKFILYLKSQFWENNRSKLVLITYAKCYAVLLMSKSRVKVGRTVLRLKMTGQIREFLLKRDRKLPFQPFHNPKFSSSPTMGAKIFEDFQPPSKKFLATPLYSV